MQISIYFLIYFLYQKVQQKKITVSWQIFNDSHYKEGPLLEYAVKECYYGICGTLTFYWSCSLPFDSC